MKKYYLFAGCTYYPSGGIDDYAGSYLTIEEADKEGKRLTTDGHLDWYNIAYSRDDGSLRFECSFP